MTLKYTLEVRALLSRHTTYETPKILSQPTRINHRNIHSKTSKNFETFFTHKDLFDQ